MPDLVVPTPEADSSSRAPDAGSQLVERVLAAVDELLRRICSASTELLDDTLAPDQRRDAVDAAEELASWLGSMNLAAEAGLTRQVQLALDESGSAAGRALKIASLVDDIRSSVRLTIGATTGHEDTARVLAVGDESLASDAAIWVIATTFDCTAVTPWQSPADYPEECDCVVVLSAQAPEPALLQALRERYPKAVGIVRADRAGLDDAATAWAHTVMAPDTGPDRLQAEIRLQVDVRRAPIRVAVAGQESTGVARSLRGRGADVTAIRSIGDIVTPGADRPRSFEALVVGADVAEPMVEALAQRIGTDPDLRDVVVVHHARADGPAGLRRHRGVDVVVPADVSRHDVASLVEGLVHRTRRSLPQVRSGRRASAPATTRIVLERMLVSSHREGRTVSVAVVDLPSTSDVSTAAAELAAEFRTDDLVGLWEGDRIVVALRGLRRRVAVERIRTAVKRYDAAERTAQAGVAEFPYDARSSVELVDVAVSAMERSRLADGPAVVAADWRQEGESAPDVMIVDPDAMLTSMLDGHLTDKGLDVVTIGTGGEAASWLIHDRRPAPRVLLLEFNTPGLDGLQLLRQLRRSGCLDRTRVLMLSATVRDDDLLAAFELGAQDAITKPFSMAIFDNRLNRVLDS
ncbi:MAG: response regulator [Actinomycetota bacterium]